MVSHSASNVFDSFSAEFEGGAVGGARWDFDFFGAVNGFYGYFGSEGGLDYVN